MKQNPGRRADRAGSSPDARAAGSRRPLRNRVRAGWSPPQPFRRRARGAARPAAAGAGDPEGAASGRVRRSGRYDRGQRDRAAAVARGRADRAGRHDRAGDLYQRHRQSARRDRPVVAIQPLGRGGGPGQRPRRAGAAEYAGGRRAAIEPAASGDGVAGRHPAARSGRLSPRLAELAHPARLRHAARRNSRPSRSRRPNPRPDRRCG